MDSLDDRRISSLVLLLVAASMRLSSKKMDIVRMLKNKKRINSQDVRLLSCDYPLDYPPMHLE